jgi:hypothetical protein
MPRKNPVWRVCLDKSIFNNGDEVEVQTTVEPWAGWYKARVVEANFAGRDGVMDLHKVHLVDSPPWNWNNTDGPWEYVVVTSRIRHV